MAAFIGRCCDPTGGDLSGLRYTPSSTPVHQTTGSKKKGRPEPSLCVAFRSGELSLRLLHHHFALVVELAFVPVSTVEEVRLTRCRARGHVRGGQGVVRAAFARTRLTLTSFRMCHDSGLFQFFQCVPTRVHRFFIIISSLGSIQPVEHVRVAIRFIRMDAAGGQGQMSELENGLAQVQFMNF